MRPHPHAWQIAALLAFTAGLHAEIDPKNFDLSVKPQDDFYQFVNGSYLKSTPIPPDYAEWGAGAAQREQTKKNLRSICERAAAKGASGTALERQVGDFFASGMAEATINAAGVIPLKPDLDRIAGVKTPADVLLELAHLMPYCENGAGLSFDCAIDAKDNSIQIAKLSAGGFGPLSREDYLAVDEDSVKLRGQYVDHVAKMLSLLGDSPEAARTGATAVMQLETALAKPYPCNRSAVLR